MMTPSYVKGDRTGVRLLAISLLFLALASKGYGQQVTGKLGSADATTTIDGKQIPSQPPKFGGVIKESAKDSTPWWPPLIVPPRPVLLYNLLDLERFKWSGGSLSAGQHTITFDFKYDGPGPGKGGTGVLSVDGKEVDRKTIPHTIPRLMAVDETFDIGSDTRTPVDDFEYELSFHFTGTINNLTYKLGPEQLSADDKKAAAVILAAAKD